MMRPAMTPKVAVPESTRWTEWIPSILRPPAWPMEVLLWLVGEALHHTCIRLTCSTNLSVEWESETQKR